MSVSRRIYPFKPNTMQTKIVDWGLVPYQKAWEKQHEIFYAQLERKQTSLPTQEDTIIFCEHPHVYTIGKSGEDSNMLMDATRLSELGATLYHIDRGGDITYHGPGQIVCYPIIDLERYGLNVRTYVSLLEDCVIDVCDSYGLKASRLDCARGIWIDAEGNNARKICAIGVRASRYITMHGLAFNVNTDLNFFNYINPCGFKDKGVTSLEQELGRKLDMKEVKQKLAASLNKHFHFK